MAGQRGGKKGRCKARLEQIAFKIVLLWQRITRDLSTVWGGDIIDRVEGRS
jgi:hypothetical protein